ncbi:hypothetical protein [Sphingomonas sp.]|uniref:hypothetical protein n=1 Tax=Sphingomonas sp. TaxID=28214 RepID=UPI003BA8B3E1
MAQEWWAGDEVVEPSNKSADWWAGDEVVEPRKRRQPESRRDRRPASPRRPVDPATLTPSGQNYDGDTYRTQAGANARLGGVDAFELRQNALLGVPGTPFPVGVMGRNALSQFAVPSASATPQGQAAWGRPQVALSRDGQDAGASIIADGLAIPDPQYMTPDQRGSYMAAQRDAIASETGAYAGRYQSPADFRAKGEDAPWQGKILMTPDQATAWAQLVRDPTTTPEQAGAWLASQGHKAENVRNLVRFLSRNPQAEPNPAFQQQDAEGNPVQPEPRGLTLRSLDALNEGIIDIVAAPFDLSHAIATPFAEAAGVDMSAGSPFSAGIRDTWHGLGLGQRDEGSAPRSDLERYGQAFLRGTGSALIPVGGTVGFGSKLATRSPSLATQASAARTAFRESLVDAARSPGTAVALEVGAGAGSYVGEEVANDVAPGNPYAAMAGQLVGGLGGGFAAGAAARRMGARSSGDTMAPARSPDAPEAAMLDDAAPMVERDGALFAKLADGQEVPIPVDPSGKPGVTWTANGWEALLEVGPDGAGQYGPQNIPGALPSPYRDLANRLNAATPRPMGAPDAAQPVPGNAGNAPEALPPEPVAPPVADDRAALAADMPELMDYAARGPEAEADIRATLNSVGPEYPYAQAVQDIRTKYAPMEADTGRQVLAGPSVPPEPRQRDVIDVNARPRPLLDPATDMERMRAAERVAPGDLLPVPSSRIADVEEAAAIDRGRYGREAAGNPRAALETRGYRDPENGQKVIRRKGPPDLVTWLRTQGGLALSDQDIGEFRQSGIDNRPRNDLEFAKGEDKLGNLLDDERGMPLDYAAMRAWEAGYFPDLPERPTIAEFMDALVATHRGGSGRVFHPDDLLELDRYRAADAQFQAVKAAQQDGATLMRDRSEPASLDDLDANAAPVDAYMEWGENAPDFAGNVRLDGLDSPQEIKRALTQIERVTGGFDSARRGRISQAETERLAGELGMTPKDLLARRKGQAFNAEQALAARQILAKSGNELVNIAKRLQRKAADAEASPADYVAFRQAIVRHAAIQEQVAGLTAEIGRALSAFRVTADSRSVKGDVLRELIDKGGGEGGILDAARAILEHSDTPQRLNTKAKALASPQFRDKALALLYFSQLSGVTTHAVNVVSNTMTSLAQIPEHFVGAGVGAIRKALPGQADTDRILFSETGARVVGWLAGAKEGFGQFARTLRTGDTSDGITKVETRQRAFTGKTGAVIDFPTLMLAAEDELFKAMARHMDIAGMAVRQARKEGLRGQAARDRAAELKASPTPEMLEQAFDYARYVTFQRPLGDIGNTGMAFLNKAWGLRVFVPYVRTPTNLLKFAAERSPIAPLLWKWSRDFKAGGTRRDMAIARWVVGTGATMLAVEAARQGLITGGGPANDSAKRLLEADGWQPYSVKVGDKYYSYRRLDPFSTTLGMAADYVDLQSHMSDREKEKTAAILVGSAMQNLSSKTWLSGVSNLGEALGDWGRYGESFLGSLAGNAVPGAVNSVAKMNDPIEREASDWYGRIRSRVPVWSEGLPARRDVLGRERVGFNGGGLAALSPLLVSERKHDLVANALLEMGVTISKPNDKLQVGGKTVQLTPQQYTDYQTLAGDILRQEVTDFVGLADYPSMTLEERKDAAEKIIRDARKQARKTLMLGEAPRPRPKAPPPGLAGAPWWVGDELVEP